MPRQVGALRAWAELAGLSLPWGVLRAIPLEHAVEVGAALGGLAMSLDRMNRGVALRNLGIAFPEDSRDQNLRLLRSTYRNFGRMAAEWVHFFDLNRHNIERYVAYDGRSEEHTSELQSLA